jgi:hypothetical protein
MALDGTSCHIQRAKGQSGMLALKCLGVERSRDMTDLAKPWRDQALSALE